MSITLTITKARYGELLLAERTLNALETAGVDNWEWYGDALRDAGLYDDEKQEEDD
jgi:hypothetical protein